MNISIVITTYNAEIYLEQTLRSIKNQTYRNYEIVLVDDGSIDNTLQIVNAFCKANPNIRVNIYPIQHAGRAFALNYGITQAKYDWIAILDSDDLWHKEKLAIQLNLIQKYNLSFLATKSKIFFQDADINIDEELNQNTDLFKPRPIKLNKILCFNLISHSSVLGKKVLFKYNINRKYQIDYDLWLNLLTQKRHLYAIEQCLVYHRIHPGQSFEAKNNLRYSISATRLQLKYCLLNLNIFQMIFVLMKLGYYLLLPKKIRYLLWEALF